MNIVLICSMGISTRILVERIQQAAKNEKLPLVIHAVSEVDFHLYLEQTDVILIGPHLSYLIADIQPKVKRLGIPVDIISAENYGRMDGKKVLQQAKKLFEKRKRND